ncbi:hypothetical protein BJ085DRAFT_10162, partial [Dimargaris cristalligena]
EYSLMDRVTQLQDSIDQMSQMFVSGLDYLHTRAPLVAVTTTTSGPVAPIPVTKSNERAERPADMETFMREFATDLCQQNRTIDTLIGALPPQELSDGEQVR